MIAAAHLAPRAVEQADLALLTGQHAVELVAAALAGGGASPVADLHVEVTAVHHRPGAGVSVCYAVRRDSDGDRGTEMIVASTAPPRRSDREDGVALLDDGVRRVRVWRRADDPALPGLREALSPAAVARWLGTTRVPTVDVLSYRPTRRAVLAVRGSSDAFLKVVRPDRAAELAHRHALMAGTPVPAPRVLAEPAPGVLLLEPARGMSLASALASGDPTALPSPEQVVAALAGLPQGATALPRRPSWVDRLDVHAAGARAALPVRAEHVETVQSRIEAVLRTQPAGPVVPTHGDLHVANLFVADGAPSALIDVDSLGPGRREDDLATMLAHLAVLPSLAPATYPDVPAVLASWIQAFARHVPAAALLARTAGVLVSLVAGAATDQGHTRVDLALEMIARAERSSSS